MLYSASSPLWGLEAQTSSYLVRVHSGYFKEFSKSWGGTQNACFIFWTWPSQSQSPFQRPMHALLNSSPGLHSRLDSSWPARWIAQVPAALPQVHTTPHLERISPGRDPAVTPVNEPFRQGGEGTRRRQYRGTDTHRASVSATPAGGVLPGATVSTSRSSHSRTPVFGLVTGAPSPRASMPPAVSAPAALAVLTWTTVPGRRTRGRRETPAGPTTPAPDARSGPRRSAELRRWV